MKILLPILIFQVVFEQVSGVRSSEEFPSVVREMLVSFSIGNDSEPVRERFHVSRRLSYDRESPVLFNGSLAFFNSASYGIYGVFEFGIGKVP